METSKVYVLTDSQNRIIRCEGGYTMSNISDISEWTLIDEGEGDRYNLCQSHYFDGGLYTEDGIPRYKLVGGVPVLRTDSEIAVDRQALPAPPPTAEERRAQLSDLVLMQDEAIVMLYEENAALEETIALNDASIVELYELLLGGGEM